MTEGMFALAVSAAAILVVYGAMVTGRAVLELVIAAFNWWLTRDLRKRNRNRRER